MKKRLGLNYFSKKSYTRGHTRGIDRKKYEKQNYETCKNSIKLDRTDRIYRNNQDENIHK